VAVAVGQGVGDGGGVGGTQAARRNSRAMKNSQDCFNLRTSMPPV
jgi:hypothetical protein